MTIRQPNRRPGVDWLTVDEVAAELRVSKMTVFREIHRKNLRAARVGRAFRVLEKDLGAYIEQAFGDGESA